jgi:spore germination protein GerM
VAVACGLIVAPPGIGASAAAPVAAVSEAAATVSVSRGGTQNGARVKIFLARGSPGPRCDRVFPVFRAVPAPAVLKGAMQALLRGPTAAERRRGYGGWFSAKTAGMLRSVELARGVASVDFKDFRRIIPNASSSCGSALLLAQLNRTATQFPTVRRAVYSFNGSKKAFYEWLQLSPPPG